MRTRKLAVPKQSEAPRRGSFLRGGNSLVALAGAQLSVGTTATETMTITVAEACVIDRLVLSESSSGLVLTNIKVRHDSVLTGYVPAAMYGPDSLWSPPFAHRLAAKETIELTFYNPTGSTITVRAAFGSAAIDPAEIAEDFAGSILRGGRSLVAIGGPSPTTAAAAGSGTLTFSIVEPGAVDRLVLGIDASADWDDLQISSIKHGNDDLIQGTVPGALFRADNPASPKFGHFLRISDVFTIAFSNSHATNTLTLSAGFSVL